MTVQLLTDLSALIAAASIVPASEIVLGRLPDDVSIAVQLRDYAGRPREVTHTGFTYRFPRVQVISRHTDAELARDRAEAIWQLFDASKAWTVTEATVNGTEYQVIVPLGELFYLPHDIHRRVNIAGNYEVRVPYDG